MIVFVNGSEIQWNEEPVLEKLLLTINEYGQMDCSVILNGKVVPNPNDYCKIYIKENDEIKVIPMVFGG